MQTLDMAKDLMFKLRLDAQDRERLDLIAANYSASASTALRILIKEKYDAIRLTQAATHAVHSAARSAPQPFALGEPTKPKRKGVRK
jgi:hypothetical protein